MAGIEFKEVSARLSCETFARRELDMKGSRARCPFHGGQNFNLRFFPNGKCYCHVCHKAGDVVQLASATWNMSQLDAARALNKVFNLGVPDGGPDPEVVKRRQREQAAREAEERERERCWNANSAEYLKACDVYRVCLVDAENMANTPQGAAAKARLEQARRRLADVWARMTGIEWRDDDGDWGWTNEGL